MSNSSKNAWSDIARDVAKSLNAQGAPVIVVGGDRAVRLSRKAIIENDGTTSVLNVTVKNGESTIEREFNIGRIEGQKSGWGVIQGIQLWRQIEDLEELLSRIFNGIDKASMIRSCTT